MKNKQKHYKQINYQYWIKNQKRQLATVTNRKKEKLFIGYNFVAIFFVILASAIFSYTIKPIFVYRYFYVVYPAFLALVTYLATYNYNTKYKTIIHIVYNI